MNCKKPYNPPQINAPGSYLVVEGVINASGATTIKLSRTVNLSGSTTVNPVGGAVITIQSNENTGYPLKEMSSGAYRSDSISLDSHLTYRIDIKTNDGKEYQSDFVPVKTTPPMDSVGFNITVKGMQLYVNTHDAANNTRYYRWDYNETWKFHSQYPSDYKSTVDGVAPRAQSENIYYCFNNDTASNITLGSSAKLSQDVIYQAPLTLVPFNSEKIETRYSIEVHQYALTPGAYDFWTSLKTNTENLGSIFDAQPSNIAGNIHNIADKAEVVIGYISACTVTTKRIFIDESELPRTWEAKYPYSCSVDSEYFSDPRTGENDVALNLTGINLPLIPTEVFYILGKPAGYLASDQQCVDCRIRGTQKQPSFWK